MCLRHAFYSQITTYIHLKNSRKFTSYAEKGGRKEKKKKKKEEEKREGAALVAMATATAKKEKLKLTKAALKREKQKRRKQQKKKKQEEEDQQAQAGANGKGKVQGNGTGSAETEINLDLEEEEKKKKESLDVDVEYVEEDLLVDVEGLPDEFRDIFQRFAYSGDSGVKGAAVKEQRLQQSLSLAAQAAPVADEEEREQGRDGRDGGDEEKNEKDGEKRVEEKALSRKQKKLQSRLKISELKQLCVNPEVVEVWDVTAKDPELLVYLKGCRNTVPVPMHWSQKRNFLQGKRGIEKPPFRLPEHISATGIGDMRQFLDEKESEKKLKTKTRERLKPKMGKIDIDYQVLHDAFFKHQKKPKLSRFGELYYEGKEFEVELKEKKPGQLSSEAQVALGMIQQGGSGAGGPIAPPPWLVNMQRYGPPPSYPSLLIPGLNAPIPAGASFGFHPGGWGHPPVDEMGNPLYGDVFGTARAANRFKRLEGEKQVEVDFDWGKMDSEEESESEYEEVENPEDLEEDMEEEDMEEEEVEEEEEEEDLQAAQSMETPNEAMNLRKDHTSFSETPVPGAAPELYKVLPEKQKSVGTNQFMGSDKTYVMPNAGGAQTPAKPSQEQQQVKAQSAKDKKKEKEFKF